MAITVPTIGSEIDVVTFGKPVVDEVNRLTGLSGRVGVTRTTPQASLPTGAYTQITWGNTTENVGGVTVTPTLVTVPVSGMYAISVVILGGTSNASSYVSVTVSSDRYDFNGTGAGAFIASLVLPLAAGISTVISVWNGSGAAFAPYPASKLTFYKVGE